MTALAEEQFVERQRARSIRNPLERFQELLLSAEDLDRLPDVEPLVDGVLERGSLAIALGIDDGILGGTTPRERKATRRKLAA